MNVAITQRIAYDPNHGERRDALAADWYPFLLHVWPDAVILPVPNRPDHVTRLFDAVPIDVLILTGGNDIGSEPERDLTEQACLREAAARRVPAIGVCRGFQMMIADAGGELVPTDRATHVATRHPVHCLRDTAWGWSAGRSVEVNSFHGFAVAEHGLPEGWTALARSDERNIEAAWSDDHRRTAVMWHPEREPAPVPSDVALFRDCVTRGTPS